MRRPNGSIMGCIPPSSLVCTLRRPLRLAAVGLAALYHALAELRALQGDGEAVSAPDRCFPRPFACLRCLPVRGWARIRRERSCHSHLIWRLIPCISCLAAQGDEDGRAALQHVDAEIPQGSGRYVDAGERGGAARGDIV